MQIFFLFYTKKKSYLFYFTDSLFQNTHISLSILHIYSIKYSFFYNCLVLSLTTPLSHRTTLSHRPRPNTQRKVAVVFVSVRAPLFSSASGSDGPMIEVAHFLDRSFYAHLSTEDLVLQAFFVVNFLYFLFRW